MPNKNAADWTTHPEDFTHALQFLHDQKSRVGDGGNFDKTVMNEAAVYMAKSWPPQAGGPKTANSIMTKWKAFWVQYSQTVVTKLLRSLMRHYIIQPITSYNNLVDIAETYVHDHSKRLHLQLYQTDTMVKSQVHEFFSAVSEVFAGVKAKQLLTAFGDKVVKKYHLPTIPNMLPIEILACLALMRKIALLLMTNEAQRAHGGDYGFWSALETELDTLFQKKGLKQDN
ncbi:hypothetical protein B0H10DRAFT_2243696 [Mycena sp. CBHHK59/15]|nr:hypothetical protein B0H10DRAFT_2243696 [Mycena sp. CBHHK59/15]